MDATRSVPAREISINEIEEIIIEVKIEVESFVHGAMCDCYSGQCLFSCILGGRSVNRGRCAQPCRLPYTVKNSKYENECYPLSLKDMCSIEHIKELIEGGIDSFKIEGRMKKAEYVAGVTAIYRKYIDFYYENPTKKLVIDKKDIIFLSNLYIRSEKQDGYYFRQNSKEMVSLKSPAYKTVDSKLLEEIRETYLKQKRKKELTLYAKFNVGEEAVIIGLLDHQSYTVTGKIVEGATKQPITKEGIEKQLKKLGDTNFKVNECFIESDQKGFYSIKEINELRRNLIRQI